jgi:hypothetical protein
LVVQFLAVVGIGVAAAIAMKRRPLLLGPPQRGLDL